MELIIPKDSTKEIVFNSVDQYLGRLSLHPVSIDAERPWGGFFCINESEASHFASEFFPGYSSSFLDEGARLSPKILVVAPGARLSWQYHYRRAELWRNIGESVGYYTSDDDEYGSLQILKNGESVQFGAQIRHRLVGLETWGIVAEFWQHIDSSNPSDELDIVRVSDDFGR